MHEGGYVEFNQPPNVVPNPSITPTGTYPNAGLIPTSEPLPIGGLDSAFVTNTKPWWKFW